MPPNLPPPDPSVWNLACLAYNDKWVPRGAYFALHFTATPLAIAGAALLLGVLALGVLAVFHRREAGQ